MLLSHRVKVSKVVRKAPMFELLGGGVLGSLIGGIFRLAPEVIKFFDKKDERDHELAMFNQQCQLETLRGQQKLARDRGAAGSHSRCWRDERF
jgi:hypothetical protein